MPVTPVPGTPLVEPGPPLTPRLAQLYSRHLLLPEIGDLGQRRLRAARVLVVGAGGLGSPVLTYLAAAGVGRLTVLDDDIVDLTNLHRQVLHGHPDVSRPKIDSAADTLQRIAPDVEVVGVRTRLHAGNAVDLLCGHHLVIDGADNFPTRYAVADACEKLGIPEVFGSVLRFDGQLSVFWPGHGPTYRDVFPQPPDPALVPSCGESGVLGAVCALVGSAMALEAVKVITGVGRPLIGRLLVLDALAMTWRAVPIRPTPGRDSGRVVPHPHLPREVPATALTELLAAGAVLLDVRTADEAAIVSIPGSQRIPLSDVLDARVDGLDPQRPLIVYCKSGVRSARAVQALHDQGFTDVAQVAGGVIGWINTVSPDSPRY